MPHSDIKITDHVHDYVDQNVTYRYREFPLPGFFHLFVVLELVLEKIGTGNKSRNRYRKNLVPEKKSIATVSDKFDTKKKS